MIKGKLHPKFGQDAGWYCASCHRRVIIGPFGDEICKCGSNPIRQDEELPDDIDEDDI